MQRNVANGTTVAAPLLVSVVVVVRNEAANIRRCIGSILAQDYPKDHLEIIVVDGMSTDGTRGIVEALPTGGIALRVVSNPQRGRAQGLNVGIRAARGEVIARIDGRTIIPPDYMSRALDALRRSGAENVGGVQRPLGDGRALPDAIGLAMAHPFGVGNAQFRLGRRSGFVDTVYLGCFRRDVFDRVGLFDEDAPVISEDSELNYRIRRAGGRVYLDASITAYYQPRETLVELWRLYFRYGGARAGVLLKHGVLTSWRQLAPSAFVLTLGALAVATLVSPAARIVLGAIVGVYAAACLAASVQLGIAQRRSQLIGWLCLVFPCMHIAWGLGFWRRLTQHPRQREHWGY